MNDYYNNDAIPLVIWEDGNSASFDFKNNEFIIEVKCDISESAQEFINFLHKIRPHPTCESCKTYKQPVDIFSSVYYTCERMRLNPCESFYCANHETKQ